MSADGARKLFVGGLADAVMETDLRTVFESAGFVVSHLALPRDRETGRLRGFAFVTLSSEEEAARARSELQGVNCAGRPLSIREFSQEPPKRGPGGPGGPGGERGERPPRQELPTVFLGKLPFEATQADIQQLFDAEGAGRVVRLVLPIGPDGRPRGFGFATLESEDQVQLAVSKLNGASLMGRQIVVSPAQAKGAPGSGGGPGGGPRGPRDDGPRRPPGGGRFGGDGFADSRGGDGGGGGGGYDSFYPPEPPMFPPPDKTVGRRRDAGKKEKRGEKRRGAGGGGEGGGPRGGGARQKRGGGGNWHRWEDDDD